MTEENKEKKAKKEAAEASETVKQQRHISVNAQYIKDLSFENPRAPKSFRGLATPPQTEMAVDINAKKFEENLYEIELKISANATNSDGPVFILELNYGGLFTITGVSKEELETILLVYCPSLIFPFARRIIADSTRDGGFPPLMLDPIDFAKLYFERKKAA